MKKMKKFVCYVLLFTFLSAGSATLASTTADVPTPICDLGPERE